MPQPLSRNRKIIICLLFWGLLILPWLFSPPGTPWTVIFKREHLISYFGWMLIWGSCYLAGRLLPEDRQTLWLFLAALGLIPFWFIISRADQLIRWAGRWSGVVMGTYMLAITLIVHHWPWPRKPHP